MTAEVLLQELAQVARALGGAVEPPGATRLLGAIAETARRLFGAQACSLALLSDDGTELVYTTAAGAGASSVTGLRLPVTRGLAGWVVQSGQPLAVSDVRSDPRFAPDAAQATGYVPQALLAAPVVSDDAVLGVLTVLDRDAQRPGAEDDLLLLQAFCEQAALALESAGAFRRTADVLLDALSRAAEDGSSLADAVHRVSAAEPDDDLAEVASLLAQLAEADPAARRLAVDVVRQVVRYAEESRRPGA